eukprot:2285239-Prymnesium_polylepis.1
MGRGFADVSRDVSRVTMRELAPRNSTWLLQVPDGSALERVEASGLAFAPFLRLRHPYRSPP